MTVVWTDIGLAETEIGHKDSHRDSRRHKPVVGVTTSVWDLEYSIHGNVKWLLGLLHGTEPMAKNG